MLPPQWEKMYRVMVVIYSITVTDYILLFVEAVEKVKQHIIAISGVDFLPVIYSGKKVVNLSKELYQYFLKLSSRIIGSTRPFFCVHI